MAAALVQFKAGTSALATTNAAFDAASTSGNLVVLAFASDDYNGTPNTGWTQSSEMEQQTFHGSYLWWRLSTGQTTFPYTIGSASGSAWVLIEFSGIDPSPYDGSQGQFQQSSDDTYTTAALTPTAGDRLLVASFGASANASAPGNPGSWTLSFTSIGGANNGAGAGTRDTIGAGYRLVTANGSTSYTTGVTWGGTEPQSRSGLIIAFKVVAGGGTNPLAGTIASASTVTGALSVTKPLAAAVASASTVTGTLQARAALVGTVSSASTVSGTLSITSPLAGAAVSASTVSGAVTVQRPLTGTVASASTVSGTLINTAADTNALAGTIGSVSSVSGSLLISKPLSGAIASTSSVTGTLFAGTLLSGTITSSSSMSGALIVRHPLTGQIVAASTLTGQIHVVRPLSGLIVGVSQVIAVLTNQGPVTSVGRIESSMVALFSETSRQSSISESTSSVSVNEATSGRPALNE